MQRHGTSARAIRGILLTILVFSPPARAAGPTDFTVSLDESVFRLADARGKYVALHFLLKTECPYCIRLVRDYATRMPSVAGVVHVFLKPDTEEEIRAWTARLKSDGIHLPIYRDADAALAETFGVPGGYVFHGETVHYPALILLDPAGREVFRHVGRDNTDRVSFETFAGKMRELSAPQRQHMNLRNDGVAIDGYDPLTYFESNRPARGSPEYATVYRGAVYHFVHREARDRFAADPEKYAPAYGGWCATAMAEGKKVEIDPSNFKVTRGRLFLFYKGFLGDARKDWVKSEPELTRKADDHWRRLVP